MTKPTAEEMLGHHHLNEDPCRICQAIRALILAVGELAKEAEWIRKNYFDADANRRTERVLERLINICDFGKEEARQ